MILWLLYCAVSAGKVDSKQTRVYYEKTTEPHKFDLVVGQEMIVKDYPFVDFAIEMGLTVQDGKQQDICYPVQSKVQFSDYANHNVRIFSPEYESNEETVNDPSYFLDSPVLVNMVHLRQGIATVTTNHLLMIYNITEDRNTSTGFKSSLSQNVSFDDLRSEANEHSVPQIVYSPTTDYIYIIFQDQVIGGLLNDKVYLRNISTVGIENDRNYIGTVRVSGSLMFVPLGTEGVDVYRFESGGGIRLLKSLGTYDIFNKQLQLSIVDVAIGGRNGEYLYVLDGNNGIMRLVMTYNDTAFSIGIDEQLGLIDVTNGITLAEHDNSYLLVLCEKGYTQYLYEVGLHGPNWFKVKVHYLGGRYYDIAITRQFAILRGKDAHRIVRPGVYDQFEPDVSYTSEDDIYKERANSYDEQYLFIPHAQTIQFYSDSFGIGDPRSWHYNLTHPFVISITNYQLVELPFIVQNALVKCINKSTRNIGKVWKYDVEINSTMCHQKYEYLAQSETKFKLGEFAQQMIMCNIKDEMIITVISGDKMVYDTEELVGITIGLLILLILMAVFLAYLYNKFKAKKDALTAEISGFGDKGYDMERQETEKNSGL